MRKLAREEAKEAEIAAAAQRVLKRQKTTDEGHDVALPNRDDTDESDSQPDDQKDDDEAIMPSQDTAQDEDEDARELSPPPRHETEAAPDIELSKANSTVFLGNVSTAAISSKSARKTLDKHLQSFFPAIAPPKAGDPKHAVISLRFRSTPYAPTIPKKAAFATKQLMDATTKSTNAYAIYSSPTLAREAVKHLNGSIVLDRHLRVDSVAHPSKVDNRRCVFVGNLGFVDDESNIQAANAEEGKEHRKPAKHPSDVEEGLWRTFGKCGVVESVRAIRDGTTRVGKGIAYVQFEDEVAVEEALGLDGKKFPPLLPRKLRVSRAKAVKRNVGAGSGRPTTRAAGTGYKRKITGEEASKIGRTGRLFGRAAAAQVKKGSGSDARRSLAVSDGIKKPEAFVFEGHRAKSGGGKSGLKLGGRKKKGGKVTGRSTAYKAKSKATAK
jgi:nucleolar protein 12